MSKADGFEGLTGHRRGVEYLVDPGLDPFLARVTAEREGNRFHESIFSRELGWLLPYDRDGRPGFTADLDPEDPEVAELVADSLPTYYPARALHDGIREFANDCAQRLIDGPVALEIEHFSRPDGSFVREFAIHYLQPGTLRFRRRLPIQLVPTSISDLKYRGRSYVELDPSTVVVIDLAPKVRALIDRTLRLFDLVDNQQFLAVDVLTNRENRLRGFDPEEHRLRLQTILLKETRELGWTESLDGVALDPFKVWRHLKFLRLQIGIRQTILTGIQEALSKAAVKSGFTAELRVSGLVELNDVVAAEQEMLAGTASITSLLRL